jgi:capsular exopolysaccharide synthesis family protein
VTLSADRRDVAEAFRTLRTNLLFSELAQKLRVIAVTSANPAEGKSITAANLAITFAQQGRSVVLVDGDLRMPGVHTLFRVPRDPGLTQVLLGDVPLEDALTTMDPPGLVLLPTGILPPNPAELLGTEAMVRVLARLKERFDIVIFDTAPVLAATDALVVGARCDGVILVVRAGRTDRAAATDAVNQLALVGARVLGAVLNDPDGELPKYGGRYYRYYYGAVGQPA